ncbi:MAG: hypothetical protein BAJALOKI3v1_50103 [Promethearchaeota archaeon]|nr:MAG: hypothetical protein BAJALOKI3v1_50103 [Candidatus Lokiarchaeota archaeon]
MAKQTEYTSSSYTKPSTDSKKSQSDSTKLSNQSLARIMVETVCRSIVLSNNTAHSLQSAFEMVLKDHR